MQHQLYHWNFWVLGTAIAGTTLFVAPSAAQLQPDNTLGSTVSAGNIININGGTTRGSNLFHSFSEFNVNTGQSVYFANPNGIENILSRVTGNNVSNIDGVLGVNGAANLFLLNPNGIIFGKNATLDINGSFTASTANSFTFADGREFQATPTTGELLTMSVPLGVQFNDRPQGNLTNSGNLAVGNGSTLTLFGKDVVNSGNLTALGGTVKVLGDRLAITDQATINVSSPTGNGNVFIGGNYQGSGELPNATSTFVDSDVVINANALTNGNGGQVIVWADGGTRFLGNIYAQGGSVSGDGGLVEVSGKQQLDFRGNVDTSAAMGINGTLLLDPDNITIVDGSATAPNAADGLWAFAEDPGDQTIGAQTVRNLLNNNSLTLQANNTITVNGYVFSTSNNDLTLEAGQSIIINNSLIQRGGGNIRLRTTQNNPNGNSLSINSGGNIDTESSSMGTAGGDIEIDAFGDILIEGGIVDARSAVINSGDAGNIAIHSRSGDIFVKAGGRVVNDFGSNGNAGNITISANSGSVFVEGSSSSIANESKSNTQNQAGGIIEITANNQVKVSNGARISTRTLGLGNAGKITISAESGQVIVTGSGSILQTESNSSGNGGPINISANRLEVSDRGRIIADTGGSGNAGGITINASGRVSVTGDSSLTPEADNNTSIASRVLQNATGFGGFIQINSPELNFSNGGTVTTSTTSTSSFGFGGTIFIDSPTNTLTIEGNGSIRANTGGASPAGALFMGNNLTPSNAQNNRKDISIQNNVTVESRVLQGATGSGGFIDISAKDLTISNLARIIANTEGSGSAGSINIDASGKVSVDGNNSAIAAQVLAGATGNGGFIALTVPELNLTNGSTVTASTSGSGVGGDISVTSSKLIFTNDSTIAASTSSSGFGGSIRILAPMDMLTISGNGSINANTSDSGNAGNISINASGNVQIEKTTIDASTFNANSDNFGNGNAGNVQIDSFLGDISLKNSSINTSTVDFNDKGDILGQGEGLAGTINLKAEAGKVLIEGTFLDASTLSFETQGGIGSGSITTSANEIEIRSSSRLSANGGGSITLTTPQVNNNNISVIDGSGVSTDSISNVKGGNIQVTTHDLTVQNSAFFFAGALGRNEDAGDSGRIVINASGAVLVTGKAIIDSQVLGSRGNSSGIEITANQLTVSDDGEITTNTNSFGNAGSIDVQNTVLTLKNGGIITASTSGAGQGGSIFLPSNIQFNAGSSSNSNSIAASTASVGKNAGAGGNIIFKAGDRLTLVGDGTISVETEGDGAAGQFSNLSDFAIIDIDGVRLNASTSGSQAGGNIDLSQAKTLSLRNGGEVTVSTSGSGNGGNIFLPNQIQFANDSSIAASTASVGKNAGAGGNIIFEAGDRLTLVGDGSISVETSGDGAAGQFSNLSDFATIDIDGVRLTASTSGSQTGGNIDLSQAKTLSLRNGGEVTVSTSGSGNGGNIFLPNQIQFTNDSSITASTSGTGNNAGAGGNIIFKAGDRLTLSGDGIISVETSGNGIAGQFADVDSFRAGRAVLKMPLIEIDGVKLSASTSGTQTGGDIEIQTSVLNFANGGEITASTSGSGTGGNLTINGNSPLTLRGNGRLTVASLSETGGRAGNLTVQNASVLALRDGIELSANSASRSGGGNVNIAVDNSLFMTGGSLINASSTNASAGDGGNISIRLGNGFLIGRPGQNNDIIANAVGGNGGNIDISALQIFGFTEQSSSNFELLRGNETNDISASSEFGFDGIITLNTLDLDPSQGLTELPTTLGDRTDQLTASCDVGGEDQASEFVVTGRGGLPPSATNLINARGVAIPWVVDANDQPVALLDGDSPSTPQTLVEAQEVAMDAEGNLYFVAASEQVVSSRLQATPSEFCHTVHQL